MVHCCSTPGLGCAQRLGRGRVSRAVLGGCGRLRASDPAWVPDSQNRLAAQAHRSWHLGDDARRLAGFTIKFADANGATDWCIETASSLIAANTDIYSNRTTSG